MQLFYFRKSENINTTSNTQFKGATLEKISQCLSTPKRTVLKFKEKKIAEKKQTQVKRSYCVTNYRFSVPEHPQF